jgi:hypothetical protein
VDGEIFELVKNHEAENKAKKTDNQSTHEQLIAGEAEKIDRTEVGQDQVFLACERRCGKKDSKQRGKNPCDPELWPQRCHSKTQDMHSLGQDKHEQTSLTGKI